MGETGRLLVGCVAGLALSIFAALVPRRGCKGRGALAVALSAVTLPIPFALHASPPWPFVAAVLLGVSFARVCEIVRAPTRFGLVERGVRAGTIFETRLMRPTRSQFSLRAWLIAVALGTAGILVVVFAYQLGPAVAPYSPSGWPRWIAGTAGGYLLFDGLMRAVVAVLLLFGWEHAPIQRAPIRSRSLAEFWGLRWNRPVSLLLQRNLFDPLARRGAPRQGILLAFVGSALLHAYLVAPVAGLVPAAWMGAFFIAQGILASVERELGVRHWRPIFGHAFVAGCFLATLPLFAEPLMRILRAR